MIETTDRGSRIETAAPGICRRSLLSGAAAIGAGGIGAPAIIKQAFASSGSMTFMGWAGFDYSTTFAAFAKTTGIKVTMIELPEQDAMLAQVKAAGTAAGVDVIEPSADRVHNWVELGLLLPLDDKKANLENVIPAILNGDASRQTVIGGKRYGSPSVWGTEAICYDSSKLTFNYGTLSLADLWRDDLAGKIVVRPWSALLSIGRQLEAEGKLPHPMVNVYKDPPACDANFAVIMPFAMKNKAKVAQFWKDQSAGESAFRSNGCEIGQVWDSIAFALQKDGLPFAYLAPKEGAQAWLQTMVVAKAAKNVEQAHAWIAWINSPEGASHWANLYGCNVVAGGGDKLLDPSIAAFAAKAYPGDAIERLAWEQSQPSWFVSKRTEFSDKFAAS